MLKWANVTAIADGDEDGKDYVIQAEYEYMCIASLQLWKKISMLQKGNTQRSNSAGAIKVFFIFKHSFRNEQ